MKDSERIAISLDEIEKLQFSMTFDDAKDLHTIECNLADLNKKSSEKLNAEQKTALKKQISEKEKKRLQIRKNLGPKKSKEYPNLLKIAKAHLDFARTKSSLNGAKRHITSFRTEVKKRFFKPATTGIIKPEECHSILAIAILLPGEYEVQRANDGNIAKGKESTRCFYNPNEYINTAKILAISGKSYLERTIGLCALTGRRPTEILLTAFFEKTNCKFIEVGEEQLIAQPPLDFVFFSGQLKTKGSVLSKTEYPIITLCESNIVIEALQNLRIMRDFSDVLMRNVAQYGNEIGTVNAVKEVNGITSKGLATYAKHHFKRFFDDKLTTYDTRHIYPVIVTKVCFGIHKPKFYPDLLGHKEGDLNTRSSYMQFSSDADKYFESDKP